MRRFRKRAALAKAVPFVFSFLFLSLSLSLSLSSSSSSTLFVPLPHLYPLYAATHHENWRCFLAQLRRRRRCRPFSVGLRAAASTFRRDQSTSGKLKWGRGRAAKENNGECAHRVEWERNKCERERERERERGCERGSPVDGHWSSLLLRVCGSAAAAERRARAAREGGRSGLSQGERGGGKG